MVLSELLKKLFKHLIYYYYYCVLCISLGKYMSQCICVDQRIILGSQLFPFSLVNQVLSHCFCYAVLCTLGEVAHEHPGNFLVCLPSCPRSAGITGV